jgi:hypothetical protein
MPEFRSTKDVFRDPLVIALVLGGILVVLVGVGGSLLSSFQGAQETSATNQPSTQSLPMPEND